ncbi:hypothetical protein [Moorena sp. SIO4G3]|uniref:hypothetical protein n=1 Tax=Moorena sp. SIO4G3 TaxID=2607821 RepID=UPI00142BE1A3|nr:hypothetical protein [Moorena sp. SIO4G3]NEO77989.1 hypothetical protein [Moorena sp. SIO4G3]
MLQFDPVGGMGILVERASWWNGHLGGMGILVEQASWWNGHLARFISGCTNAGYEADNESLFPKAPYTSLLYK